MRITDIRKERLEDMHEIKQLTQEEKNEIIAQFPGAVPKEYQLLDDEITYGFYDTYEEAVDASKEIDLDKEIGRRVDYFVENLESDLVSRAQALGIDRGELRRRIKDSI